MFKRILRSLSILLLAAGAMPTRAADAVVDAAAEPALAALFAKHGLQGSFVLVSSDTAEPRVHDPARAARRYLPASTFKIPNALIGLSTGAVENVDTVLPYGGEPQPFKSWEQDLSLRRAMPLSSVPIYRELARRIGLAPMRDYVQRLNYGNQQIGEVVDRFWLDGPLAISANEQVAFLTRLARAELPLPAQVQATVTEILLLDQGTDDSGQAWRLYGKTGLALDAGIGWWVGWVQRGEVLHVFALNVDMHELALAPKRIELGRALLTELGALPVR